MDRIAATYLTRRLDSVSRSGAFDPKEDAVTVIVANHTSRYDGFLVWNHVREVSHETRVFTVMLAREIERHPVFRGAGAIGIEPGDIHTLRALVRFVENELHPGDCLVLFPQGKIFPGDRLPLGFRSITRLVRRIGSPTRCIPVGLAVEVLHRPRPSAFMLTGRPVADEPGQIEQAVTALVRRLREGLLEHGESLPSVWNQQNWAHA